MQLRQNNNILNRNKSPQNFLKADKSIYSPKLSTQKVRSQQQYFSSNEKSQLNIKGSANKFGATNNNKSQAINNPFLENNENQQVSEEQTLQQQQIQAQKPDEFYCYRHRNKLISKICVNPKCTSEIVALCSDCLQEPEGQQHYGNHKDSFMGFKKFIEIVQQNSFRFKQIISADGEVQQPTNQEKDFNNYINDMDKYVVRYRNHIQKEEQKIDQDFDALIEQFTNDIYELKDQLKLQLRDQLTRFNEVSGTLTNKAQQVYSEKGQNKKNKNEYDEFLINIGFNSSVKKPYNMKKLLSSISPQVFKTHQKQSGVISSIGCASSCTSPTFKKTAQKKANDSHIQPFDLVSQTSFTSNPFFLSNYQNGNNPSGNDRQQKSNAQNTSKSSMGQLYEEVRYMSLNKPTYRNKGEANMVYRNSLEESKKIFYKLKETLDDFVNIESYQDHITTKKLKNDKSKKLRSIDEDDLTNYDDSNFNKIFTQPQEMHLFKTLQTSHTGGITSLKIVEANDIYITGSCDKSVKIWDLSDHTLLKTIKFPAEVTAISVLPRKDGSFMYIVGLSNGFSVLNQSYDIYKNFYHESQSNLFNVKQKSETLSNDFNNSNLNSSTSQSGALEESNIKCPMPPTNQLVGLRDGESVVVVSKDHRIMVYNVITNENPKKYFEHRDSIYCIHLFPNSNFLATGGKDSSIKIFRCHFYKDFKNNALEKLSLDLSIDNAHKSDVTALNTSANYPNILISGAANGEIKLWDTFDGALIKTISNSCGWVYKILVVESELSEEQSGIVKALKKQQDENCNYTGPSNALKRLVSPSKRQQATVSKPPKSQQFKNFQKKINAVNLENINFLTASFDGTLQLWEADNGNSITEIKSKNYFECYPFGAVSGVLSTNMCKGGTQKKQSIQIMTTGNKNDPFVNQYMLQ